MCLGDYLAQTYYRLCLAGHHSWKPNFQFSVCFKRLGYSAQIIFMGLHGPGPCTETFDLAWDPLLSSSGSPALLWLVPDKPLKNKVTFPTAMLPQQWQQPQGLIIKLTGVRKPNTIVHGHNLGGWFQVWQKLAFKRRHEKENVDLGDLHLVGVVLF